MHSMHLIIDGKPFAGKSKENNYEEKVVMEGVYYE